MTEITLESLAARVAALEKRVADLSAGVPTKKEWWHLIGTSEDNESTRAVLAEIEAHSEAERRAAREGRED